MEKVKVGDLTSRGIVTRVPSPTRSHGYEISPTGEVHFNQATVVYEDNLRHRSFGDLKPGSVPPLDLIARVSNYRYGPFDSVLSGTDPEILAFGPKGDLIPAWDYLPHQSTPLTETKEECLNAGYIAPTFNLYWDGAQAEFSLNKGYHCHELLVGRIRAALAKMHQTLQLHTLGAALVPQDVAILKTTALRTLPFDYINLGCSPSLNAYNTPPIEVPDPRKLKYRFAGCHTHFSFTGEAPAWFPNGTVVMMDKLAGLALCALGRGLENPIRRKYYGRPGEYRLPKATPGTTRLEYRTPSNFILWHPALCNLAFDICRAAFHIGLMYDGRTLELPETKDIIQACDADAACKLIKQHSKIFTAFIDQIYNGNSRRAPKTLDVMYSGWKPQALVKTWGLGSLLPVGSYYWYQFLETI